MDCELNFFLIDEPSTTLPRTILPTNKQVLSVFLYHHLILGKSIAESDEILLAELKETWKSFPLTLQSDETIKRKLNQLYKSWQSRKKSINKSTQFNTLAEQKFCLKLNEVFNIAAASCLLNYGIEDRSIFLKNLTAAPENDELSQKNVEIPLIDLECTDSRRRALHLENDVPHDCSDDNGNKIGSGSWNEFVGNENNEFISRSGCNSVGADVDELGDQNENLVSEIICNIGASENCKNFVGNGANKLNDINKKLVCGAIHFENGADVNQLIGYNSEDSDECESRAKSGNEADDEFSGSGESEYDSDCDLHCYKDDLADADYKSPKKKAKKKMKIKMISDKVIGTLDRFKVSHRHGSAILLAMADDGETDLKQVVVSPSTVRRAIMEYREKHTESLKEEFEAKAPDCLTVHEDGKKFKNKISGEEFEVIAIVVTGKGTKQLLAVVRVESGTGLKVATVTQEAVNNWCIGPKVKAICFDNCSVNTGKDNGVCVHLELQLKRQIAKFGCRRHFMELIIKAVWTHCYKKPTSGPDVKVFLRFAKKWPDMDKSKYKTGKQDKRVAAILKRKKEDVERILKYLRDLMKKLEKEDEEFGKKYIPRDDYKELIDLVRLFLGDKFDFTFRKPGPVHHARWMAKEIYCLKMFLFRGQFRMTANELKTATEMALFTCLVFIRFWICAPDAICASRNDLELLKSIKRYESVNAGVSKVALRKLMNHLWYLSEENVCLGFYDDNVSTECKLKMVQSLDKEGANERQMRGTIDKYTDVLQLELNDFTSQRSWNFFKIFGFSTKFLEKHPDEWSNVAEYLADKETCKHLGVTNDCAERAIKLTEDFDCPLTSKGAVNNSQLISIAEHRQQMPSMTKKAVIDSLQKM